ncbi:alpha/beta hydrolase fold domain-containing protein [Dermatobacter hominis]|uniref:alpha/beta hydrolase fold domain-containing protein n=1 Tax=Dermatobacter hominis TaxID=2884263 RepID=UPI001D12CB3F|nr:alpha/beta hydrolase fold domain-containing protein [Dermatobacter hominis]UDY37737.1 alpha/beta hydrolase [Dermatobacter hominis]
MAPARRRLDRVVVDPGPDDRLAGVVAGIRALRPGDTLAARRAGAEHDVDREAQVLLDDGFAVAERSIDTDDGPLPVQVVEPPGALSGTLVAFHGGGYVLCSPGTHALRFARMAQAARCRLLNVGYPLAPEHPFPAAVRAGVRAVERAAADGPVVLLGDSAGGGLVLSVALSLRDGLHGAPDPAGPAAVRVAGLVAISPWTDLTCSAPSLVERRSIDPFAHIDDLPAFAADYLRGGTEPTDPVASPLFADLAGLPPTLVQVGSTETMYDDAARWAERAAAAGVAVRLEEWEGMFHTWHGHVGELTGADLAVAAIGSFVRERLDAAR